MRYGQRHLNAWSVVCSDLALREEAKRKHSGATTSFADAAQDQIGHTLRTTKWLQSRANVRLARKAASTVFALALYFLAAIAGLHLAEIGQFKIVG
ncbi:MAG: hypothetical protein KBT59_11360, partial [Sphingomonadales bacterium]|nr:hypothetical protein [Sphingomonadales bacterium]